MQKNMSKDWTLACCDATCGTTWSRRGWFGAADGGAERGEAQGMGKRVPFEVHCSAAPSAVLATCCACMTIVGSCPHP